jgi:YD repeat-containing protein
LVVSASDVQIAGRAGLASQITRTYNGLGDSAQATAGRRWTLAPGLDTGLETLGDGTRVWHGLTGEVWRFAPAAGGGFTSPAAIDARLKVNTGGSVTITENQSGSRYDFDSGSPARLQAIKDRNNNTISLTYASGRVSKITDRQARELVFAYDAAGDLDTITDPTARVWRYDYDTNHRLITYTDPESKVTRYRYDASGRIDQITDPRGNLTQFGYDTSSRVTSVKRVVDGTTTNDVTTTYAYSAASAPCATGDAGKTVVTDPLAHATTYCADSKDQVVKVRNAKGQDADRSYTPNGDTDLYTDLAGTANSEITDLTFATSGTDPANNLLSGKRGPQEPFSV